MNEQTATEPDAATQEVAKPATTVLLSEAARGDLKSYSRATRAILARTMRDELLEPSNWKNLQPLPSAPGRFVLPIGKFRVIFKMLEPEAGQTGTDGRLVERIVRAGEGEAAERTLTDGATAPARARPRPAARSQHLG